MTTRSTGIALLILSVAVVCHATPKLADVAIGTYQVDLDGRRITFYILCGQNPHQDWPSHYLQNPMEAKLHNAGGFQVRHYMTNHPADWLLCYLDVPDSLGSWQLCHSTFVFYNDWSRLAGGFMPTQIRSVDYVFSDGAAQTVVIPGRAQVIQFPKAIIPETRGGATPIWIAFPQGSLHMIPIDEYLMRPWLPNRVAIINNCRGGVTWLAQDKPEGG